MADLRKAEKLAAAKKRLKQFQQKRDFQSESGRSTPSKKKSEDEDLENGGSTLSLSQSENLSSNISGTDSPVCDHVDNTRSESVNGNGLTEDLPNVSQSLFKTLSEPIAARGRVGDSSVSAFFDNLAPHVQENGSGRSNELLPNAIQAVNLHLPKASTPEGPRFEDTPNYSFPDISVSPIVKNETTMNCSPRVVESKVESDLSQNSGSVTHFVPLDSSVSPIVKNDLTANNSSRESNHENGSSPNANTEQRIMELHSKLEKASSRNAELEQQISEQKSQILQLQSHLEDMKKKADESASTLKHHLKAIEILVAEKTELQNALEKRQEEERCKENELQECAARLSASRHRASELERELDSARLHARSLEASARSHHAKMADVLAADESLRKRVGDLELEVSDLQSKLEIHNQTLNVLNAEMEKKTSELSLAEVRIQQLSNGVDHSANADAAASDLQRQNAQLAITIAELRDQLSAADAAAADTVRDYQRHVARLNDQLECVRADDEKKEERCRTLEMREQQLVVRLSEMERELSNLARDRTPAAATDSTSEPPSSSAELADDERAQLREDLDRKDEELGCLRAGLEERSLRIQELEVAIASLEADRPDAARLQAAIESDKVAASRAVAQNNDLKKQLEELQEALVTLSNNKLELTERLQNEQHISRDLSHRLDSIQECSNKAAVAVDNAQQTERPNRKESTVQTLAQPTEPVSQEMMSKLEEKFNRKMAELAELSDEKQRLEHLVLQLQGETETIGEYITLYQIQRGMLRQRAQEKDEQVAQLGRDKEALRAKLAQLDALVRRLLPNADTDTAADAVPPAGAVEDSPATGQEREFSGDAATAVQIRSLLTEIGSSNLVSPELAFHPCPWCSGRLITV